MSTWIALDYWQGREALASSHARALGDLMRDLRGRVNETIEENIRLAIAAKAVASAVQNGRPPEEIAAAAAALTAALHSPRTLELSAKLDESVSIYAVTIVLNEMLSRLKLRKELAQAAEKWALKQLRSQRISKLARQVTRPRK